MTTITKLALSLPLILTMSGCAIPTDRAGYSEAWYYERLNPYYTNKIVTNPRMFLRAVRGLVGFDFVQEDGSTGQADYFRSDIEIFFSARITDQNEQIKQAERAIRITCPDTDVTGLKDKVVYSNATYIVLQDVPCIGHVS